jgi:hypothetical protein
LRNSDDGWNVGGTMQLTKSRGLRMLMVATAAGLVLAGCGRSTAVEAGRHHRASAPIRTITTSVPATVAVPEGWKTYTYGKAAVSVPGTWQVKRDTNCPNTAAPGALLLGYPKTIEYCPAYQSTASYLALIDRTDAAAGSGSTAPEKPEMINGVAVYVGFGSPAALEWTAPSLGIEIIGAGPLADRIVSTLRRA